MKYFFKIKYVTLLLTCFHLLSFASFFAQKSTESNKYLVVNCHDGDTCRLQSKDNISIKVRLIGIDAPEVTFRKKEGQPFGKESKEFINQMIKGKEVTIKNYGLDIYGRNLAEIYYSNETVNIKMVENGFAEVYKSRKDQGINYAPYDKAQEHAQKLHKGIWTLKNYQSPSLWRQAHKN